MYNSEPDGGNSDRNQLSVSQVLPADYLDTALFKRVRYKVFVESLAERGSQQKLWFYLSAKRCISRQMRLSLNPQKLFHPPSVRVEQLLGVRLYSTLT